MKKYAAMTVLLLTITASATGCGNEANALRGSGTTHETTSGASETSESETLDAKTTEAETLDNETTDNETTDNETIDSDTPTSEIAPVSKTDEIIGGKVRSISHDSFVISRVIVDEDGYIVVTPEKGNPDEVLVTVRCTDSTVFEHWTIEGGGAGIDKRDAAFSEIKEDAGLEAEGYFDGDVFVAKKVIIETYK